MSVHSTFVSFFDSASIVSFDHQTLINEYLRNYPPIVSELTFSNIFCWRHCYPRKVFEFDNHLMMGYYNHQTDSYTFLQPVGENPCAVMLTLHKQVPIVWHRVYSEVAKQLGFSYDHDGCEDDFVYSQKEMAKLEGSAYGTIRRKINKLKLPYVAKAFSEEDLGDCLTIVDEWLESKRKSGLLQDAHHEDALASLEMLANANKLGVFGIVCYVDDRPKAFALGEGLSEKTGVIHFHKGDFSIEGLGARSLRDMARHMDRFQEINFMQAKGDPGLTTWKRAWNPSHLVPKCVVPSVA